MNRRNHEKEKEIEKPLILEVEYEKHNNVGDRVKEFPEQLDGVEVDDNKMNDQRQRSTESLSLFSHLPEELIPQILLRLPVRSLLRFKSVCKSWLSLISDPQFCKSHFDLAAAPTYRCLANRNFYESGSLDVDSSLHNYESSIVNFKFPLSSTIKEQFNQFLDYPDFLGSCRGFVLVAYAWGHVFVWNPSTGVHRTIADNLEYIMFQFLTGFGYDTSRDDYVLVLIDVIPLESYLEEDPDIIAHYPTRIEIFSMKTNSWFYSEGTNVQYVDLGSGGEIRQVGSFLNGALHWLVITYETKLHVIIAFDLVKRSLLEIPLSPILAMELKYKEYYLRVMGECLSLCYPGDADSTAEIWMMKEYKEHSSWTKLFVFSTCNIPRNGFFPICFTTHGRIFGSNGYGRLLMLNDKGSLLDQCATHTEPDKYQAIQTHCGMYRETLLSFPNAFEEASDVFEEASEDDIDMISRLPKPAIRNVYTRRQVGTAKKNS